MSYVIVLGLRMVLAIMLIALLLLGLSGVYIIYNNYGTGTIPLILPTIIIIASSSIGLRGMYNEYKREKHGFTRI